MSSSTCVNNLIIRDSPRSTRRSKTCISSRLCLGVCLVASGSGSAHIGCLGGRPLGLLLLLVALQAATFCGGVIGIIAEVALDGLLGQRRGFEGSSIRGGRRSGLPVDLLSLQCTVDHVLSEVCLHEQSRH